MERRTSNRKRTATKVFLHHAALPAEPSTARDLSSGGVFVTTPNARRLQVGASLEITFAVDLGNVTQLHKRSVEVAHVADDGLGLVIVQSTPSRTASERLSRRVNPAA